MAKKPTQKKKTIKKKWYPILAPKIFNEVVIGETYLTEPDVALGRTATANLMNLTGDVKSQSINIKFNISAVDENKLQTKPDSYEMGYASIKRLVRRKRDKLEDSILVTSKDGVKVRIKPLVLTRYKAKGSVKTILAKTLRQEIMTFVRENEYDIVFNSVISRKLQRSIKDKLNKIYPVKICAVRMIGKETKINLKDSNLVPPPERLVDKEEMPAEVVPVEEEPLPEGNVNTTDNAETEVESAPDEVEEKIKGEE